MKLPGVLSVAKSPRAAKLTAGVVAGLAIAVFAITQTFDADDAIGWVDVAVDDLELTVEIEGTLAAREAAVLSPPQLSGFHDFQIRFMAPEGSEVATGQPVLAFDPTTLSQQLLQLQTQAQEAAKNIEKLDVDLQQQVMDLELRLAEAQAAARRAGLKDDVPADLRSANQAEIDALDVELAQMQVASLEGQIQAAQDSGAAQRSALVAQRDRAERLVAETQTAIQRMTVTAPREGTVIYVTNWRGEKKKVGDQVWRSEGIIELPDLTTMMARGEVDESDAGRIAEKQPVAFRLDAHPDVQFTGKIESIWRTIQRQSFSRNPIRVVRLDLELDETDSERMRPGMRFRGTIRTDLIEGALVVPVGAVFRDDDASVVYRKTVLGHEVVPVELGRRNSEFVEVLGGLAAGDRVAETRLGS